MPRLPAGRPGRKASLAPSEASVDGGLFDQQALAHEVEFVQHGDSSPGFPLGRHLDETKPSPLTGLPVLDNADRHDISGAGEESSQLGFTRFNGKIGYIYFLVYFGLLLDGTLPSIRSLLLETLHAQQGLVLWRRDLAHDHPPASCADNPIGFRTDRVGSFPSAAFRRPSPLNHFPPRF